MLKTLRITSLIAMIAAALGVVLVIVFGLKGDPASRAVLDELGIIEKFAGKDTAPKSDDAHPLVTQARKFALRLNPPPPPKPKEDPKVADAKPAMERKPVAPTPPVTVRPPTQFELLATVRYESDPSRSLVLLKSGNTIEWFRQGEKAGNLTIDEVRDGSALFSQGGKNQVTMNVPAKTEGKSLLKSDQTAIAASGAKSGLAGAMPTAVSDAGIANRAMLENASGSVQAQPAVHVQRVRTEPVMPTPQEQQAQLDSSIAGIQEILSRPDENMTEEERKAETETWNTLLNALKGEKEALKAAESESRPAPTSEPVVERKNIRPQRRPSTAAARSADKPAEPVTPPAAPEMMPEPQTPPEQPAVEDEGGSVSAPEGEGQPESQAPPAEMNAAEATAAEIVPESTPADEGSQPAAAPEVVEPEADPVPETAEAAPENAAPVDEY